MSSKRIQETSIEVLRSLKSPAMLDKTHQALQEFIERFGFEPTSGELTQWLVAAGRAFDVNSVRPPLTWLKDAGRVTVTGKRVSGHSGKLGYTWRPL